MISYSYFCGHECVKITCGGYTAILCPSFGGNCLKLTYGEASFLRTPPDAETLEKNPHLYGLPLLLPPNRIAGGEWQCNGRTYRLPVNEQARQNHLHGYIAQAPFELAGIEKNSITMRYHTGLHPVYACQGLLCQISITYSLSESGLEQKIILKNEGDGPFPLGLGLHASVCLPFLCHDNADDIRLRIPALEEWTLERSRVLPNGQTEDTALARALRRGAVIPGAQPLSALVTFEKEEFFLTNIRTCSTLYCALSGYPFAMLWNADANQSFLCVEPQSWIINAPNVSLPAQRTGYVPLAPQESRTYGLKLSFTQSETQSYRLSHFISASRVRYSIGEQP